MLNISKKRVNDKIDSNSYDSLRKVTGQPHGVKTIRFFTVFFIVVLLALFLPWTQTIRSKGMVTTRKPDQRPQTIHSIIGGRIEQWFVQEGDFVHKGDTILFISEIKDEYFDPELLTRTQEQVESKTQALDAYMQKVRALDNQINALEKTSVLKLQQAENKRQQALLGVRSDSIDFEAARVNESIAKQRLGRTEQLYKEGLKSLTDLESRKLSLQKATAEIISAENKLLASKNEAINAEVELTSISVQYQDDIAKAQADKFTALSAMYDAEAVLTKLQNQYMNYSIRRGLYYITAPQDGYVTQAIQVGLGETIKEGDDLVSIMPAQYDLAVEMYVRPIDLPLLSIGQPVRLQFDGWPAIVFSGWPNTSYGTYGGKVVARDNFISTNGLYRIMVAPDPEEPEWPNALRVGAGTKNLVLLQDVPVWYELWRNINGFPPDFYAPSSTANSTQKAEIK